MGKYFKLRFVAPLFRRTKIDMVSGVHQEEIPWSGPEGYGKNLTLQMGRCPVRSTYIDLIWRSY
jgi:hypothetical protein